MVGGFGTIRKDAKGGGWIVSVYIRGVRLRKRARTYGEAQARLRELRRRKQEIESGATRRLGTNPHVTYWELVRDLRARWERDGAAAYSEKTLESYRAHLDAIERDWGPRHVAETREVDVERVAEAMRGAGRATATIAHRLKLIRQLHRLAVERGYLSREPCPVSPPRPRPAAEVDPVGEEELERLIDRARELGDQPLALLLLMADAGLRRGEPVLLLGRHVDLTETSDEYGAITVPAEGAAAGGRPRGARGRRVPILTLRLRDALTAVRPEADRRLITIADSAEGVARAMKPVWRPVLGGRPQLQRLRHRYGVHWAAKLRSVATLAEWMGHRETSTTERYFQSVEADTPVGLKE